jgi:hypothetical protein
MKLMIRTAAIRRTPGIRKAEEEVAVEIEGVTARRRATATATHRIRRGEIRRAGKLRW